MTRVCRLSPLPKRIPADVEAQHARVQKQKEREMADYDPSEAPWLEHCAREGIVRPFVTAVEVDYTRDEDREMPCAEVAL